MNNVKLALVFCLIVIFQACQKEESIIIDERPVDKINTSSPLTALLARVSQNPTAKDNVLDSSSCFSVVLPVTVIVNSQSITVTSDSDYATVQQAIDAFSNDDDIVNFNYPITVKLKNFQTVVVNTPSQLDDLMDDCDEDDFDEIDCLNINYPITINAYNAGSQTPISYTINSDSDLYNFIQSLTPEILATISYPISITNPNGQSIVITSNSQLEDVIDDAIDDCNSSSGGGGGSGNPDFTAIVTTGTWRITYYFDESDQTSYFNGYNFTFNTSGSSVAIKNSTTINGSWSTYLDSGINKFDLTYDGSTLDEIEEDWRILEFNATTIRLKDISGGDGSISYLTFTKN